MKHRFYMAGFRNAQRGLTLIELMIVVVIIGIIAAIAVPAYQDSIERSRVRTAGADLVALAVALENRFQRQLSYSGATTANVNWQQGSDPSHFTIAMSAGSDSYTLTATGSSCTLTLDEKNNRTMTGSCGGLSSW